MKTSKRPLKAWNQGIPGFLSDEEISWSPFFIVLTIVPTTGNQQGEAEQLLFEGWETIELLSDKLVRIISYSAKGMI